MKARDNKNERGLARLRRRAHLKVTRVDDIEPVAHRALCYDELARLCRNELHREEERLELLVRDPGEDTVGEVGARASDAAQRFGRLGDDG